MKNSEKFIFNTSFQWDVIKYTILEPKGYRALHLYDHSYFTLVDQQIIAKAITRYFQKRSRIPSYALLVEELNYQFRTRDYINLLKEKDRTAILKKARGLYKGGLSDPEAIKEAISTFASYVEFKDILGKFDITQYDSYAKVTQKLQGALNRGQEITSDKGSFIVTGYKSRIIRRKLNESVFPTPFKQLNRTTNAGGYPRNSVIVIMDKEKGGKTLSLVNVARGYLKLRKKVVIFDLENGLESYEDRIDQSILGISKHDLLSGDLEIEKSLARLYRKYARIGAELYVRRLPAGCTMADIERELGSLKQESGFIPQIVIVDYLVLMNPIRERTRDDLNISQVYIEAKNLAQKFDIESFWTANHVKMDAYKRRATRYRSGDAAKALDIGRNADAVIGVNQNKTEEASNILRWEIVDQRDGVKGVVLFDLNQRTQQLREFTKEQRDNYLEKFYKGDEEEDEPANGNAKPSKNDLDD